MLDHIRKGVFRAAGVAEAPDRVSSGRSEVNGVKGNERGEDLKLCGALMFVCVLFFFLMRV